MALVIISVSPDAVVDQLRSNTATVVVKRIRNLRHIIDGNAIQTVQRVIVVVKRQERGVFPDLPVARSDLPGSGAIGVNHGRPSANHLFDSPIGSITQRIQSNTVERQPDQAPIFVITPRQGVTSGGFRKYIPEFIAGKGVTAVCIRHRQNVSGLIMGKAP